MADSTSSDPLKIAVIDNRDSFVFNLVRYLEELGCECTIFQNTIECEALARFDGILISPGPGDPKGAGNCLAIIEWAFSIEKPLLGVCLGHQAIAEAFGGEVGSASQLLHGETSTVEHDGVGLFADIPNHFTATRYHSLAVRSIPAVLNVTATSDDGEIMGLEHRSAKIFGVQFHPESVLTEHGHHLLGNWLEVVAQAEN